MAQRRGDLAKQVTTDTIVQAFGDKVAAIVDKKIYVNVPDGPGGEIIQIAISMTMPKVAVSAATGGSGSTGQSAGVAASTPLMANELSPDDKAAVDKLMRDLGISD